MHFIVLCGGDSVERAVSLRSGERVTVGLRERGHTAELLRIGALPPPALLPLLSRADAVFLALHGGAGEDGRLQRYLEENGISHYTGATPDAAALAMQKDAAKAAVRAAGVAVAPGTVWNPGENAPSLTFPAVIKPLCGGSSVGVCFLEDRAQLEACTVTEPMLCEPYLSGREFSVGVLGDRILPAVEILAPGGRYDYAVKYEKGRCRELCPAPLSPAAAKNLEQMTRTAFRSLGLRDFARLDFREDSAGTCCFLEANTLPGMTETSLLPLAASTVGISFGELCEQMLLGAIGRHRVLD